MFIFELSTDDFSLDCYTFKNCFDLNYKFNPLENLHYFTITFNKDYNSVVKIITSENYKIAQLKAWEFIHITLFSN